MAMKPLGSNSFYHDDDMRSRLEASVGGIDPVSAWSRSMRLQMRFEITEGIGDVRAI